MCGAVNRAIETERGRGFRAGCFDVADEVIIKAIDRRRGARRGGHREECAAAAVGHASEGVGRDEREPPWIASVGRRAAGKGVQRGEHTCRGELEDCAKAGPNGRLDGSRVGHAVESDARCCFHEGTRRHGIRAREIGERCVDARRANFEKCAESVHATPRRGAVIETVAAIGEPSEREFTVARVELQQRRERRGDCRSDGVHGDFEDGAFVAPAALFCDSEKVAPTTHECAARVGSFWVGRRPSKLDQRLDGAIRSEPEKRAPLVTAAFVSRPVHRPISESDDRPVGIRAIRTGKVHERRKRAIRREAENRAVAIRATLERSADHRAVRCRSQRRTEKRTLARNKARLIAKRDAGSDMENRAQPAEAALLGGPVSQSVRSKYEAGERHPPVRVIEARNIRRVDLRCDAVAAYFKNRARAVGAAFRACAIEKAICRRWLDQGAERLGSFRPIHVRDDLELCPQRVDAEHRADICRAPGVSRSVE